MFYKLRKNIFMIQKILKEDFHKYNFLSPLLQISQCPKQIYYRGNIPDKNNDTKVLCVIGSRKATSYGKEVTDFLLSKLGGQNVIIVSGLAMGIDTRAHEAAIRNKIITVSFPGSGLDDKVLYPQTNIKLADKIVEENGCMMSEYEPETKSALYTFPARNRLMAAISDLILVVEAEEKSGTQITARLALEYGKDVAIVPGSIFSAYSRGTAQLFKSGANPITTPEELCEELGLNKTFDKNSEPDLFEEKEDTNSKLENLKLNDKEKILLELLKSPLYKDDLITESSMPPHEALIALTNLEAKGYIKDNFGEIKRVI